MVSPLLHVVVAITPVRLKICSRSCAALTSAVLMSSKNKVSSYSFGLKAVKSAWLKGREEEEEGGKRAGKGRTSGQQ